MFSIKGTVAEGGGARATRFGYKPADGLVHALSAKSTVTYCFPIQVQLYQQRDIPSMERLGFAIQPGVHSFVSVHPYEVGVHGGGGLRP